MANPAATAVEVLESNMTTVVTSFAIVALILLSSRLSRSGIDPEEPPEISAKIPFIGHIIGMLTYHIDYYSMLISKHQLPIFTMRIFGSSMYVISSPELIQSVLRNPRSFSFEPMIIESTNRTFDISKEGAKVIGNKEYIDSVHKAVHETMLPGPALVEMNSRALSAEARLLNSPEFAVGKHVGLYRWIRDCLTLAAADALYGPDNPINDNPKLIDLVWDFEKDFIWLMLRFFPTLTASKAHRARYTYREAFRAYYSSSPFLPPTASLFIHQRLATANAAGLSRDDFLNVEIGMLFTASTNTVPSTFWFLAFILSCPSSPSLINDLRTEIAALVTRKTVKGVETAEMDTTAFATRCPLLVSCWEETLRLADASSSVRMVAPDADARLSGAGREYLLKAGSVVQMPAGVTHLAPEIWGPDAAVFDPRRFLRAKGPLAAAAVVGEGEEKADAKAGRERRRVQAQGYFPFGGGKHLCPGRHFVLVEILTLVATLVYGFEIWSGLERGGAQEAGFVAPDMDVQRMGAGVRKPVRDVDVLIKARAGFEGVKWAYYVG